MAFIEELQNLLPGDTLHISSTAILLVDSTETMSPELGAVFSIGVHLIAKTSFIRDEDLILPGACIGGSLSTDGQKIWLITNRSSMKIDSNDVTVHLSAFKSQLTIFESND